MADKRNPYFDRVATKGRNQLILNRNGMAAVEKLASMQCTDEDMAGFLDVCVDTLLNKNNKEKFMEAKQKGKCLGRVSIRRMQFKAAEAGNVSMLIWLGKQFLGQKEQPDVAVRDSSMTISIVGASAAPKDVLEGD